MQGNWTREQVAEQLFSCITTILSSASDAASLKQAHALLDTLDQHVQFYNGIELLLAQGGVSAEVRFAALGKLDHNLRREWKALEGGEKMHRAEVTR